MRIAETPQYKLAAAFCKFALIWKEMTNGTKECETMPRLICILLETWMELQRYYLAYKTFGYYEIWTIVTKNHQNNTSVMHSGYPQTLDIFTTVGAVEITLRSAGDNVVPVEQIVSIKFGDSDPILFEAIEIKPVYLK